MRFLNTKKGFTLTELLIVVTIMGILVAVAVPVYNYSTENQKKNDCLMNREVIETVVEEVMTGMIDNGKKQTTINMSLANPLRVVDSPANFPEPYNSVKCFKLTFDENAFTLGDIRGGYRVSGDYDGGCEAGYFLKRADLAEVKFYKYLASGELPYCSFNEEDGPQKYYYYVFSDGTVLCDCPECIEMESK